jgi:hypothetical protein
MYVISTKANSSTDKTEMVHKAVQHNDFNETLQMIPLFPNFECSSLSHRTSHTIAQRSGSAQCTSQKIEIDVEETAGYWDSPWQSDLAPGSGSENIIPTAGYWDSPWQSDRAPENGQNPQGEQPTTTAHPKSTGELIPVAELGQAQPDAANSKEEAASKICISVGCSDDHALTLPNSSDVAASGCGQLGVIQEQTTALSNSVSISQAVSEARMQAETSRRENIDGKVQSVLAELGPRESWDLANVVEDMRIKIILVAREIGIQGMQIHEIDAELAKLKIFLGRGVEKYEQHVEANRLMKADCNQQ